ncbi:MAG: DHA2 family efflux MFS transporter permease subunit [Stenotrophobium sp.]
MSVSVPVAGDRVPNHGLITITVMLASILQALDNTIANVALPHMQGSLSATQDQMTWVLTSYIVAAAIMTPLTGWLSGQFGRKRLFLFSIIGFTISSALCGMAQSLPEIVLFRLMQGLCGAALVPMSQAVLFDINPPEHHGRAMSVWGFGVVLGPTLGPMIGGWLTDNYSWRWVFYINVPFGILAVLGILAYLPETKITRRRFDMFGFALLSLAIGALQIMLDRGPLKDWFNSREIWTELIVASLAFYLFAVHSATSEHPFIRPELFKDRNFLAGTVLIFMVGIVLFATLALLPTMLQNLMGYTALQSGYLTAPRGVGTLIAMQVVGRLIGRIDSRRIIAFGFILMAISLWQMTQFSLLMDGWPVIWSGVVQGFGTGIAYVPMATMAFATLNPTLRDEGAAMFNLMRNIGSSIGISMVQALLISNTQTVHSSLSEHISPYNLAAHSPQLAAQLATHAGTVALNAEVTGQAAMIAYIDDFHLMLILTVLSVPLLFFVRKALPSKGSPQIAIE